jgi:phosphohistidine phosphatase
VKTLYLLRHAKAAAPKPDRDDHARALTERGRRAADLVGALLAARSEVPEVVLCSSARRTRETLAPVLDRLNTRPRVRIEPALYLADCDTLLSTIRVLPDEVECALLVGHNPGIEELAQSLATKGRADRIASLHEKFPTAGLAILRLLGTRWQEVGEGVRLEAFVVPRELES